MNAYSTYTTSFYTPLDLFGGLHAFVGILAQAIATAAANIAKAVADRLTSAPSQPPVSPPLADHTVSVVSPSPQPEAGVRALPSTTPIEPESFNPQALTAEDRQKRRQAGADYMKLFVALTRRAGEISGVQAIQEPRCESDGSGYVASFTDGKYVDFQFVEDPLPSPIEEAPDIFDREPLDTFDHVAIKTHPEEVEDTAVTQKYLNNQSGTTASLAFHYKWNMVNNRLSIGRPPFTQRDSPLPPSPALTKEPKEAPMPSPPSIREVIPYIPYTFAPIIKSCKPVPVIDSNDLLQVAQELKEKSKYTITFPASNPEDEDTVTYPDIVNTHKDGFYTIIRITKVLIVEDGIEKKGVITFVKTVAPDLTKVKVQIQSLLIVETPTE